MQGFGPDSKLCSISPILMIDSIYTPYIHSYVNISFQNPKKYFSATYKSNTVFKFLIRFGMPTKESQGFDFNFLIIWLCFRLVWINIWNFWMNLTLNIDLYFDTCGIQFNYSMYVVEKIYRLSRSFLFLGPCIRIW